MVKRWLILFLTKFSLSIVDIPVEITLNTVDETESVYIAIGPKMQQVYPAIEIKQNETKYVSDLLYLENGNIVFWLKSYPNNIQRIDFSLQQQNKFEMFICCRFNGYNLQYPISRYYVSVNEQHYDFDYLPQHKTTITRFMSKTINNFYNTLFKGYTRFK